MSTRCGVKLRLSWRRGWAHEPPLATGRGVRVCRAHLGRAHGARAAVVRAGRNRQGRTGASLHGERAVPGRQLPGMREMSIMPTGRLGGPPGWPRHNVRGTSKQSGSDAQGTGGRPGATPDRIAFPDQYHQPAQGSADLSGRGHERQYGERPAENARGAAGRYGDHPGLAQPCPIARHDPQPMPGAGGPPPAAPGGP